MRNIFYHFVVMLTACFFAGCHGSENNQSDNKSTSLTSDKELIREKILSEYTIHDYINKFRIIDLPFKYRSEYVDADQLKTVDPVDTIYTKDASAMYYGILSDTTFLYHVITLLPGDDYVPILTTYDKEGNRIDSKMILGYGCGGGPCIHYFSSTSIINKDLTLFCTDTVISSICNDDDRSIEGTDSIFTAFFYGKITQTGMIEFGKTTRISVKK